MRTKKKISTWISITFYKIANKMKLIHQNKNKYKELYFHFQPLEELLTLWRKKIDVEWSETVLNNFEW